LKILGWEDITDWSGTCVSWRAFHEMIVYQCSN